MNSLLAFLEVNYMAIVYAQWSETFMMGKSRLHPYWLAFGYDENPGDVLVKLTTASFLWGSELFYGEVTRFEYPSHRFWKPDYVITSSPNRLPCFLDYSTEDGDYATKVSAYFSPYKVLFPMHLDLFKV